MPYQPPLYTLSNWTLLKLHNREIRDTSVPAKLTPVLQEPMRRSALQTTTKTATQLYQLYKNTVKTGQNFTLILNSKLDLYTKSFKQIHIMNTSYLRFRCKCYPKSYLICPFALIKIGTAFLFALIRD